MTNSRILVLAAHPDDEVLGCGATIARHVQNGDEVRVVILAEGIRSRGSSDAENLISELRVVAQKANKVLGVESLEFQSFPDNQMDTVSRLEVAQAIEKIIKSYSPTTIYTHNGHDVNIDHRRIFEAVVIAGRAQPGSTIQEILSFEVPSSTEWQLSPSVPFVPNWFVNVSDTIKKKLQALEVYSGEMRPWPHARSIKAVEHLMRWRGASVGYEAAEAFVLQRKLIQ
jgi:N-acetylglucosamine malate deacetylase 1